ncbi:MAG: electron transfer flavoprotein subunit beta/FixA family protein, partial [Limnochordia bacterium]
MRILVCIKQVPDPDQLKIDPQTGILIRDGVKMIFNPYDYPALEAALQLKEASQGEVIALTMGPP